MSAEGIRHTLMGAVQRGNRDEMPGCSAACTWTLTPPGTTSGFAGRGGADAERSARFARKIKAAVPGPDGLVGQFPPGPGSAGPACSTCHAGASGLAGRVNEHAAMPGLAA
jgi:hypothetical protein